MTLNSKILEGHDAWAALLGDRIDLNTTIKSTHIDAINEVLDRANTIIFPLGGEFLLDPNEFNGWGNIGPYDNRNSQDLSNVGSATINRLAGGLSFPFDVQINRFFAWHHNNNADAEAWGWRITQQQKTDGNNVITTSDILNEVSDNGGTGPRNYSNNLTQQTDISFGTPITVPSGDVITLGVESPTAVGTNRFVRVMSGYFELRRV